MQRRFVRGATTQRAEAGDRERRRRQSGADALGASPQANRRFRGFAVKSRGLLRGDAALATLLGCAERGRAARAVKAPEHRPEPEPRPRLSNWSIKRRMPGSQRFTVPASSPAQHSQTNLRRGECSGLAPEQTLALGGRWSCRRMSAHLHTSCVGTRQSRRCHRFCVNLRRQGCPVHMLKQNE